MAWGSVRASVPQKWGRRKSPTTSYLERVRWGGEGVGGGLGFRAPRVGSQDREKHSDGRGG